MGISLNEVLQPETKTKSVNPQQNSFVSLKNNRK